MSEENVEIVRHPPYLQGFTRAFGIFRVEVDEIIDLGDARNRSVRDRATKGPPRSR